VPPTAASGDAASTVTDTVRFDTDPDTVGRAEPLLPLGEVGLLPPPHPGSAVPTAITDMAWQACTQKSRRFTDFSPEVYAPRAMAARRSLASRALICWL
jgi:hypothetical protein